MRSPMRLYVLVVFLLGLTPPAFAQLTDTFQFPQGHDTVFGGTPFPEPPFGPGAFGWYSDGTGAKGRRTSNAGIDLVQAIAFDVVFKDSCLLIG